MSDRIKVSLSRRQALALGAAAAALAAIGYPALRQIGSYPDPGLPVRNLSPKEVAVYRAVGDFLLPPGGPLPGSGGDDVTIARLDAFLGALPPHHARVVSALPQVVEHGAMLDRFGARSMTGLPADRRQAYLAGWAEATTLIEAQLWSAIKLMYGVAYFERADVRDAIGLPALCGKVP